MCVYVECDCISLVQSVTSGKFAGHVHHALLEAAVVQHAHAVWRSFAALLLWL